METHDKLRRRIRESFTNENSARERRVNNKQSGSKGHAVVQLVCPIRLSSHIGRR